MGKLLISGATIITMREGQPVIENGSIAVEDDKILYVGPSEAFFPPWVPEQEIKGQGKVVLPGLVNTHTHAAMTLLRGFADDLPLMRWLNEKIWPAEANLTPEDIYWGTMLSQIEMIRSGTTTFNDMYFFMEETARAVEESGMRACLARGLTGFDCETAERGLQESRELVRNWHGAANGRIKVMLGPHAPYTCPPAFLARVAELAGELKLGIHIHLAETRDEITTIAKEYGKTPVEYANDLGIFEHHTLAAHCVHLTEKDMEIMETKNVSVAHNPESNMKLASGTAPVTQMLNRGITVGLGTDGASSNNNLDLIGEMRTAALLQKAHYQDTTLLPAYEALKMATVNGARALGLSHQLGVIKQGMKADLIVLDVEQAHLYPKHNIISSLVYSAHASDVVTVIIDGKPVMYKRELLTIDEEKVMFEVQRRAMRIVNK